MFFSRQHLHFAGIGGIGMSGIAEVLLNLGYTISGSDLKLTPTTERLAQLGATIYEGHAAKNVAGAKALVVSSAVDESNPEVQEARRLQIPVIPRGELLAELMRLKYGIAVAGSHGKTTTTSMIATILSHAGMDPTVVVGGKVSSMGGSNARVGHSDFLVVESDESDGSFLKLSPILAIVTNIDREHLDHYSDIEAIRAAFTEFVNKVPFYGAAILCLDSENVQSILPHVRRRTITYGRSAQADFRPSDQHTGDFHATFHLRSRTADLGEFHLNVPGDHNVLNATAAIAVAAELGVPPDVIREGLRNFTGVGRRFEVKGVVDGVTVIDDYGHHPTEILATLAAAKSICRKRIHVLFQPHRYTRTRHLMDDFARAFHAADQVVVLDIYGASEKPIEGVTASALVDRMRQFGHRGVEYASSSEAGVEAIARGAEPGDIILTLGAGSVSQLGDKFWSDCDMPKPVAEPKPKINVRVVLRVAVWILVFAGVTVSAKEVQSFLETDARFRFEKLEIRGAVYTSRARIQGVFQPDFNRSVFQLSLAERRRHVLAVDWVRTASLMRVWPDRIVVSVTERKPVAFAKLPVPGTMRHWLALVDDEGILLSIPPKSRFSLPVLSGITEEQSDEERRLRVESMMHLLADLGPQAKDVSEVNAADAQDMRVIAEVDGQAVELWLGDQRYRPRYLNFLSHYPDIRRREERASVFD